MLPIVDKPTIQYIVEEAVDSGIHDIYIVIGDSKRSIQDHFDQNIELELALKEKNKLELLRLIEEISSLAAIHYIKQEQALGLGHAIWCARNFIGNEPFAVLLGDMVIDSQVPCLKQLIDVYNEKQSSVIGVEKVDWAETGKYGIIRGTQTSERLTLVTDLIEKPKADPPSNMAIIGRYILEPQIFDFIGEMKIGEGGEIQLTDALQQLIQEQPIWAYQYEGKFYDVGDKLGFLQANVELAVRNDNLGEKFKLFLQKFVGHTEKG
jgi:UTP--glucose-1-phosphate uridylyltransferase